MSTIPGYEVVFLLGGAFREAIDAAHRDLAQQGHPEARPLHAFALQAIGPHGVTVSELGRRLGVSKQAAAKTARTLETAGYVRREPDPTDARASVVTRTQRGVELLALGAASFERHISDWRKTLGPERFEAMIAALREITSIPRLGDFPGWLG